MSTKFGILPYDTDDDSVVFRCPMTSLASITDLGGADKSTGNNVFDSVKGMNMQRGGDNKSGVYFRLSAMTTENGSDGSDLPQGQISFEIERVALTIPASVTNSESNGYDNSENKCLISWSKDGLGVAQGGYFYKRASANDYDVYSKAGPSGTIGQVCRLASNEKQSDWATLTISWQNGRFDYFFDGYRMLTASRSTTNQETLFGDIYLGSYVNATSTPNWDTGHYIRNIIMSARPVTLSYHPSLAHIMMVGDSFAGGQVGVHKATTGHLNENNVISEYLHAVGYDYSTYTVYSNGGGTVLDAGADPLQDDVNGSAKTRATAASEKPTFIIFQGGVNDVTSDLTNFLTDLKDHINEFMADGTTYTANKSAKRMILVAQCSGTNTVSATIPSGLYTVRDHILSIPAWWDAAHPSRAGHVQVVDQWEFLRATESTIDPSLYDQFYVHPNSLGDTLTGKYIAQKMLSML